jgi:hypothetical protein
MSDPTPAIGDRIAPSLPPFPREAGRYVLSADSTKWLPTLNVKNLNTYSFLRWLETASIDDLDNFTRGYDIYGPSYE